jgi:hypothetical protein
MEELGQESRHSNPLLNEYEFTSLPLRTARKYTDHYCIYAYMVRERERERERERDTEVVTWNTAVLLKLRCEYQNGYASK